MNKLTNLIVIALIATLTLIIIVMENQHSKTIAEYLNRENKLENELTQSIKNYTELEEMYLELKRENIELKEANKEIADWKEFICTGYSANDGEQGTNNIVATTFNLDYTRVQNLPIAAVDPEVIPLYSIIEIKDMGAFISLDTGVKGNRIDILFSSKEEAIDFGIQEREVRVIK